MRKLATWCLAMLLALVPGEGALADEAPADKVILDTDMTYVGDDSYCLFALLQADAAGLIDLLGCTTVGGNVSVAEATQATLRQLELAGRADVPVYIGSDIPLMGLRDDDFYRRNGLAVPFTVTKLRKYPRLDYRNLPDEILDTVGWNGMSFREWGETALSAKEQHAAAYMVEQARKYPGEVTIIAIGACTNVALACRLDAQFAANVKRIIYMGGAIDVPGNVTRFAELNWFHDPEAAQVCLTAGFAKQALVPHDLSFNVSLDHYAYELLKKASGTPYADIILRCPLFGAFETDESASLPMWDLATVIPLLKPELITKSDERYVRVDIRDGSTYGMSMSWGLDGNVDDWGVALVPGDVGRCEIVYALDNDAFWDYIVGLYAKDFKG